MRKPQAPSIALRALALVLTVAVAPTADASLSVLAFDDGLEMALVRNQDPNQGVMLQVRELRTGKVKKSWFVDDRNAEKKRVHRLTRKKYPINAEIGQVDPKGRYTVIGAPDGKRNYNIMILRDGRVGILGKVPLKKGVDEKYAEAMLKEVVWAPGGKQVIVVVNQKFEQEYGKTDTDELHWFRFRQWKIEWLKPAKDDSSDSGTDSVN